MPLHIKMLQWSSTKAVTIQRQGSTQGPAAAVHNTQLNVGVNILLFEEFRDLLEKLGRKFCYH